MDISKITEKLWHCEYCFVVAFIADATIDGSEYRLRFCWSESCKSMRYFRSVCVDQVQSVANLEAEGGDLIIVCIEHSCKRTFKFTRSEQEFFSSKGFVIPKRCKNCRSKLKEQRLTRLASIKSENPDIENDKEDISL